MRISPVHWLVHRVLKTSLILVFTLPILHAPVSAQISDNEYEVHLHEAIQRVLAKDETLTLGLHKLPESVGDTFDFKDALSLALAQEDSETVASLLQPHRLTIEPDTRIGFVANIFPYQPESSNLTAAEAIRKNDMVALQAAMSQADFAIDDVVYVPYDYGVTLLMIAATKGNADMVRLLIDAGADPNGTGEDISGPLSRAVFMSHFEVAGLLVQAGAKVNIRKNLSSAEETVLAHFVNLERVGLVKQLLDQGANADTGDRFGWTPLMNAVHSQNLEMVQLLLPHSNPLIKSEQEITVTEWEFKEIDAEYPIVDALEIAARFDSPTGKQIAQAVQSRVDDLELPAVSLATQLDTALKETRKFQTSYDITAAFDTASNATGLLANAEIDESTEKDVINPAIYLLLYKHELGLIVGETLNENDQSLADKLNAQGSKAQKWHDMLDVLDVAQNRSAQAEIDAWEQKYGVPKKGMWNFDLLSRWIDSNTEISTRDRMYDTLDYFELR
jgi:ankyrin repeat protein